MKNNPVVSVVIPTYKRVDTLDRAIDSVLKQTYSNIEVIVVDDNNPDTEGRIAAENLMKTLRKSNTSSILVTKMVRLQGIQEFELRQVIMLPFWMMMTNFSLTR